MGCYIVLVTKGKRDRVDSAQVHLFDDHINAMAFTHRVNTGKEKYWTSAEIVGQGETIELEEPDWL